jgi:hypothetical protein
MKLEFGDRFSNNLEVLNFIKAVESEPSCSMGTEGRRDMAKVIVAFRNFAKAPNTVIMWFIQHYICVFIIYLLSER